MSVFTNTKKSRVLIDGTDAIKIKSIDRVEKSEYKSGSSVTWRLKLVTKTEPVIQFSYDSEVKRNENFDAILKILKFKI